MKWILAICIIVIILLLIKIYMMKKAAREIRTAFSQRANLDTNTWITITGRDKDMCMLANEINQTLEKVRRSYYKYEQGDREMKTAITNLSHDIRTPLTAICGYLTLMKRINWSEEMEKYLDIVEERAGHMKKLTEELFAYSVVMSEEEKPILEELSLNRLLEDCLMEYYAALAEKGIIPNVTITEKQIVRKLNKVYMERVLSNLMSNVLKYSDGDLQVSLSDRGMITFANTAENLTPVLVERLFERFYTVETARNSVGLGLAIAKTFVERMGGRMRARHESGKLVVEIMFE